jgi:hypothetical protein
MPARSDDPLRRVTLNLYASDCEWLASTYGHGWTERIRQHIHNEVVKRQGEVQKRKIFLGDLADD